MKKKYSDFFLRKCTLEDIDKIYNFQNLIIKGLNNKEILRKNTKKMFEKCVMEPNITIGLFDKLELVGIAIYVDEHGTCEDLSLDLTKHQVNLAANLKLIMVKKEYRGNKFQKCLMLILEKCAYNRGYTHFCVTVSDKNIYSLNNIKLSGYEFDHHTIKYGGLSREVYVKDITKNISTHNKIILDKINSWVNKQNISEFEKYINFDNFFQSELQFANTGDILEYKELYSECIYYGLLIKDTSSKIYIYLFDKQNLQLNILSININNLKLKKIWIKTDLEI